MQGDLTSKANESAQDKFSVADNLLKVLNDKKIAPNERVKQFAILLAANEPILLRRRDSATMTFLKVVATIFSLGIAAPFLWKVKSASDVKGMKSIFAGAPGLEDEKLSPLERSPKPKKQ